RRGARARGRPAADTGGRRGDPASRRADGGAAVAGGRMSGRVYLVGAGPGDPGLLTARALELIARADVILYDRLIPASALDGARADAELLFVGKEGGGPSVAGFPGTLVFYMGVRRLEAIASALIAAGRPSSEPAAVVQEGTLPTQRVLIATLGSIAEQAREDDIRAPAIAVVGPVAALAE